MEGLGAHTLPLTHGHTNATKAGGCSIHAGNLSWEPEHEPEVKAALNCQESLILYVCRRAEQPEHPSLSNKQYFIHY